MKKRIVAFLLTLAMLVGLVPQMMLAALADELAAAYTLENDFIRVSVSKKNGGFTVATREGDRLKKSDNNKNCSTMTANTILPLSPSASPMREATRRTISSAASMRAAVLSR